MDDISLRIYDLLYRMGVTARCVGFLYISYAIRLCAEQPERPLCVTQWVYPDVAKRYGTDWRTVAQDIGAVGGVLWQKSRPMLEELARRPLERQPENGLLLSILAAGISPPDPLPWQAAGLAYQLEKA